MSAAVEVRMLISVGGLCEGVQSPKRGEVVTVSAEAAHRLIRNGYAQSRLTGELAEPYRKAG